MTHISFGNTQTLDSGNQQDMILADSAFRLRRPSYVLPMGGVEIIRRHIKVHQLTGLS